MVHTHNAPTLVAVLNKMSINFLEMLESEDNNGIMVPTRYIIEDGQIKGVVYE